jgi:hypothetical protein
MKVLAKVEPGQYSRQGISSIGLSLLDFLSREDKDIV